jgi:hypothetical protein
VGDVSDSITFGVKPPTIEQRRPGGVAVDDQAMLDVGAQRNDGSGRVLTKATPSHDARFLRAEACPQGAVGGQGTPAVLAGQAARRL